MPSPLAHPWHITSEPLFPSSAYSYIPFIFHYLQLFAYLAWYALPFEAHPGQSLTMISPTVPRKLWEHPDPQSTAMYKFMQSVNKTQNQKLSVWLPFRRLKLTTQTYNDFYQYSISHRAAFWDQCFQFLNIIHHGTYTTIVDETARIDSVPRWFEGVHLNFAENLLYSRAHGASSARGKSGKEDDKIALTQVREGASDIRNVSWAQLRNEVGKVAAAMRAHGVRKGDRIVVVASNSVDTLRVFLATTWLGGLFSSSSTDLGVKGVLQRALQVSPRVGGLWSRNSLTTPVHLHGRLCRLQWKSD
jgi:acetoacetyl-CoA synthetase